MLVSQIESAGLATPWFFALAFLAASFLMIWRLEAMSDRGMEGTVLGTLVMPYCSGLGNLAFAVLLATKTASGAEVMTNCLVNNVTNLTLLLGLPAVIWGLNLFPQKKKKQKKKNKNAEQAPKLNRLSLLMTLFAILFFTGATWALARDGKLDFSDGLVLVGLFAFWQCVHVFEVLKNNVRQNRSLDFMFVVDMALLAVGAYAVVVSIDWLVDWLSTIKVGFFSKNNLGWLSGWLMVLPNALLALYYGWKKRPEVIYSSQVGDGHICIPLCIGLFALFKPMTLPPFFEVGVIILGGAALLHCFFVGFFGQLPRAMGVLLVLSYFVFLKKGLFE